MRKTEQKKFQKILTDTKHELLVKAQQTLAGDMQVDPDDIADEIDAASSDSQLAFIGRLRERERMLIEKIDEALARIGDGTDPFHRSFFERAVWPVQEDSSAE